jgi:wobble nucleotide-excising tRNase
MLEKIIALENVGLFLSGAPKGYQLRKATLVYADNARGKSTLSAILQACAANDCDGVTARATIGAKGPPVVRLRFQLATGGTSVTFENGKCNTAVLNLQVFDQGFVERNVYAGSEVHPDHHQALLDFAIGSAALRGHATMLRTKLEEAAALKALSPLSAADPAIITRAGEAWASVERILTEYNQRVATANDAIAAFKKELAGENKATSSRPPPSVSA